MSNFRFNIRFNNIWYQSVTELEAVAAGIPDANIKEAIKQATFEPVRSKRDYLIKETDWTQIPDAPLSNEKKAEFTVYRQALRDIPQAYPDPDTIVWPEKPII